MQRTNHLLHDLAPTQPIQGWLWCVWSTSGRNYWNGPPGHQLVIPPPPAKRRIFPLISIATNIAAFLSHRQFVDQPGTRRFIVVFYNFSTGMDGYTDGQQVAVEATTHLGHCTVRGCFFDVEVFYLFTLYKDRSALGALIFFWKAGVTWNLRCLE